MDSAGIIDGANPLDVLDSALDQLTSDFLPSRNREDLGERCLRLLSARDRLDAVIATSVAEADRAGVPLLGKQRTMAAVRSAH